LLLSEKQTALWLFVRHQESSELSISTTLDKNKTKNPQNFSLGPQ